MTTRRDFLKGSGALVVSFSAQALLPRAVRAAPAGQFGTQASHIDGAALDAWLAVGADGRITAYTGKCDLGQGIFTAQVQLVAEELYVPMAHVTMVECDTAVTPDQGTTSGSQSTPVNFNDENLGLAAATAREVLLEMASKRLGAPVARLAIAAGVISSPAGARVTYGELVGGRRFELPLRKTAKRKPPSAWTTLGKPVTSLDRVALVTGRFEYVHHLRVPGMLHGRVVRPPDMGATLAGVDASSARGVAGFVDVVVRESFVGVVARTQFAAMVAAERLKVRWKPGPALPPRETFFDFLRRQPSRDQIAIDSSDVDAALERAGDRVIRARYTYPYQMHGSLGPSCAVADVRADGVTVWSPTQSVYPTRSCLAKLLGVPIETVRVVFKRGSGCYGLNGADAVSFDAAILSQAVRAPVRVQFTRQDEMKWENYGAACAIELRAVLGSDGAIAAWDREAWVAALGSRPGYDRPGNIITGMLLGHEPEPLAIGPAAPPKGKLDNRSNAVPAYVAGCIAGTCGGEGTIRSERVVTHTVRSPFFTGPLRSPLRIQNTFANESFMDEVCARAGTDPVAFRLRHLRDERIIGVLRAAAKAAQWQAGPRRERSATGEGIARGRGVACVSYEGHNGYAALIADVDVHVASGVVHPRRYVVAIDCGPISNPDGLRNQVEGGLLQGTSRALVEEVTWDEHRVTSVDWSSYPSLHLDYDVPAIETVFVTPTGVPATGAGETSITLVPAAISNAVFDATRARLRDVPFTPARVLVALRGAGSAS
ncbi:MAG TPA: molybdopterin cofactor-binding domain-containing protein [Kofleriaceae bacterium]|nr:molybdopterin cofactor-binding domain-containing protein [Kofleriaceae bacterium]